MNKIKDLKNIFLEIRDKAINEPLYNNMIERQGNIVIHRGSLNPYILFIGEAPGFDEDKVGIPFIGRSGEILNKWCDSIDSSNHAVINTYPLVPVDSDGKIRKPTENEKKRFLDLNNKLIKELNPKYIILLGRSAEYYSKKSKNKNILNKKEKMMINGEWYENQGFIYHPSYYLRNGKDGVDDFNSLINNIIGDK
jgi:DNA polymerase